MCLACRKVISGHGRVWPGRAARHGSTSVCVRVYLSRCNHRVHDAVVKRIEVLWALVCSAVKKRLLVCASACESVRVYHTPERS